MPDVISRKSVAPVLRPGTFSEASVVRKRHRRKMLLALASALTVGQVAFAADRHWDGGAGTTNWFDADNWTNNQVPQSDDDATIGCDIHARNATVDIWSGDAGCGELRLADLEPTNVDVLRIRGGTLTNYTHSTGDQHIAGYEGTGTIELMGGTHKIYGGVLLGYKSTASGTYRISGTGYLDLTYGTSVTRGSGASTFIMDGGSVGFGTGSRIEANDVYIGMATGSNASLSLGTTNRIVANYLYLGFNGTGTLTQNTGSGYDVTVATQLRLGENTGSRGTYNLAGGKLSVTGHQFLGLYGDGIVYQTAGTNELSQNLWLGYYGSGGGVYRLHGGNLNFTATGKYIYVGYGGTGRFEWYGGTITAPGGTKPTMQFPTATHAGTLAMGWSFDVATLAAGGYLPVPGLDQSTLEITNGATATQNSGDWSIYQLQIGAADGNGIYNFNAGTGNVTYKLWIGRGTGRTGTLNMQGGTATVATCRMADDANSTGILNLASGSFTVGSPGSITTGSGTSHLYLDGGSLSLQATTKTVAVSNLTVGLTAGSPVSYEFGTGYAISSTTQYVGFGRNATLILSGNAADTTSSMVLGSTAGTAGTIKLRGSSSLSASSIANGSGTGHVYIDGGSLTLTGGKSLNVTTLAVGMETGANPSWTIADGYNVTAGSEYVGNAVSASLLQTGGTNIVGSLTIGGLSGVSGTFTITGGSTGATSGITLATNAGSIGTLKLRGGTLAAPVIAQGSGMANIYLDGGALNAPAGGLRITTTNLYVGGELTGNYTFGPGYNVTTDVEYIGYGASGWLIQTAGSQHTAGAINLAYAGNVTGTLALNGGSLTVGAITSGEGTSTLSINDGTLTFLGAKSIAVKNFNLGDAVGSDALFELNDVADSLSAVNQNIGSMRNATLRQSAGFNYLGTALNLGGKTGTSGAYEISGGQLSGPHAQLNIGSPMGGMGRLHMSGNSLAIVDVVTLHKGTFEQTDQATLCVNRLEGFGDHPVFGANLTLGHLGGAGSASYSVGTGQSLNVSRTLTLGYTASAAFTQTGGEVTVGDMVMGERLGASASYVLDGGNLFVNGAIRRGAGSAQLTVNSGDIQFTGGAPEISVTTLSVGRGASGKFTQTGGLVEVERKLAVGQLGGDGRYDIVGGVVRAPGPAASLIVREDSSSSATVEGYGIFEVPGTLTNNGRIVANGYGFDGNVLDLSRFSAVINTINNPFENGTNGWFAVNHGKLLLPPLKVTNPGRYYWGESPSGGKDDADIDLVNSVQVTFSSIDQPGNLLISLLSPDRDDVTFPREAKVVGLWDFRFQTGEPSFSADLAFRYDDALAARLGIDEHLLELYHWSNGAWERIPASIDAERNLIFAGGITSFSPFAVGTAIPSPAALPAGLMLLTAVLATRRARRR